jgi:ligand-binding sensor domain-containing protein
MIRINGAPPRVLALLVASVAAAALAAPAAQAARWDTYNNANRLNSVNATRGDVWTASDLGLHRYDPDTGAFTRFAKNFGQLAANAVTEVEVDPAGNTWMATRGSGVSVLLATGAWRTLTIFDGLPSNTVLALELSSVGMWVGTESGVSLFDGLELIASWPDGVNPSPFLDNEVQAIAHVADSTWIGTPNGAYVTKTDEGVTWLRRVGGLTSVNVRSLTGFGSEVWAVAGNDVVRGGGTGTWTLGEEGLPDTPAYTIAARGDSMLLGAGAGVFLRTAAEPTWQLVGSGFPVRAWVDFADDGSFWAGNVEGLWRWTGTAWTRPDIPGPGGNLVVNIALEGSRPWISTRDRGISRFDGASWRTFVPQVGATPDTTFYSVDDIFMIHVAADGTKWAGDWGSSIAQLDDSGPVPAFTHYYTVDQGAFDIHNTFAWSSAQDPFGNMWIGLDTSHAGLPPPPFGLHRITPSGQRATFNPQNGAAMSNSQVRAIAFAPGATFRMWVGYAGVGSNSGIDIFTDPTLAARSGRISVADLASNDIWGLAVFGDSMWVGHSSGLSRYSIADGFRKENIGTQAPSPNGAVRPLALDATGGVWWATQAGLYHRRTDRTVEVFTSANSPLLSDDIRAVAVDQATGDVWIGTDAGVNRYDPDGITGPPPSGIARFTTYPNPAYLSAAGVRLFGAGVDGPFTGRVIDVRGRTIRTLRGNASNGGLWDATDSEGRRVAPGLYFIAVTQGGTTRTGRVLLVR